MVGITLTTGILLVGVLALVLAVLAKGGAPTFSRFGLGFLISSHWDPPHQQFGALPFVFGTLLTSFVALVLSVPVAVGLAILLNEPISAKITGPLATFIDVLAAIPSVVFGLVGLFVIAPWMERNIEPLLHSIFGWIPVVGKLFPALSRSASGHVVGAGGDYFVAGAVLSIMILPIVTAISREVVATVPRDLREAAKALGATRYETIRMAVLPYSAQGIAGAAFLGLGRALGETIAVSMVIGGGASLGASLFAPGQSIASAIASQFNGATNQLQRSSLLALGVILVALSFGLAALSKMFVSRGARRMESAIEAG
ncbi:MAG: phosphate transport system permease protein [Actinomycetota bacterium]|nr:phosphate transport system permease protein [Actinomycetota bacterium]